MFPTISNYINIHSHRKPVVHNEFVIRNGFLKLSVEHVEKLSYPISAGLHPWHIEQMSEDECYKKLKVLAASDKVLAIGEIGIDRSSTIPVDKQMSYFELQLHLAEEFKKPVILHAVRSYSDFLPYLKKSKVPFIFHRFNGNITQAKELLKYNCRLSFGKNLFNYKFDDILKELPQGTFLLETDSAHHIHIADIYNKVSEIRAVEIDVLKEELFYTFAQIFKN